MACILTNVSKLAIFKDNKVVLVGQTRKLLGERRSKVLDNVDVGLD